MMPSDWRQGCGCQPGWEDVWTPEHLPGLPGAGQTTCPRSISPGWGNSRTRGQKSHLTTAVSPSSHRCQQVTAAGSEGVRASPHRTWVSSGCRGNKSEALEQRRFLFPIKVGSKLYPGPGCHSLPACGWGPSSRQLLRHAEWAWPAWRLRRVPRSPTGGTVGRGSLLPLSSHPFPSRLLIRWTSWTSLGAWALPLLRLSRRPRTARGRSACLWEAQLEAPLLPGMNVVGLCGI